MPRSPALLVAACVLLLVPSPAAAEPTGPLAGLRVNLDPGHNPGNARHAAQVNRIVERGPIRKACDTTGTATSGGFAELRFTGMLATRLGRRCVGSAPS